jgi:hypothetical protein
MGNEDDDNVESDQSLVRPTQRSLDVVARHVNSIHICDWQRIEQELRPKVLLIVDDPMRMKELLGHVAIVESDEFFHCMCCGSLIMQLVATEGVVATLTLHHGTSVRWDDAWDSDAWLRDGWGLADWLAQHGVPQLLVEMKEAEHSRKIAERQFAAWRAAMPPCLTPFYQPSQRPMWRWKRPTAPILAALTAAYGTAWQAILALCEWHGTLSTRPWNGLYPFEFLPDALLEAFGTHQVLEALEKAVLTERQFDGVARYLVWHRIQAADIPLRVAVVLRARGATLADRDKAASIRRLLGDE